MMKTLQEYLEQAIRDGNLHHTLSIVYQAEDAGNLGFTVVRVMTTRSFSGNFRKDSRNAKRTCRIISVTYFLFPQGYRHRQAIINEYRAVALKMLRRA